MFVDPDVMDLESNSTNLYVKNLAPTVTEPTLMDKFGKYGDIASVKIMWPRTDEEIARGSNRGSVVSVGGVCYPSHEPTNIHFANPHIGFVSFMRRKDAERAIQKLQNSDLEGNMLRIGWGKGVAIPDIALFVMNESNENEAIEVNERIDWTKVCNFWCSSFSKGERPTERESERDGTTVCVCFSYSPTNDDFLSKSDSI